MFPPEVDVEEWEVVTEEEEYWQSIGWTEADYRPSAISIGSFSMIILVAILVVIVCLDSPSLRRDLARLKRNVLGQEQKRRRWKHGKPRGKGSKQVGSSRPRKRKHNSIETTV